MKKYLFKKDRGFIIAQINIILTSLFLILFEFFKGYLLDVAIDRNWEKFLYFIFIFLSIILLKCLTFYIYCRYFLQFKTEQMRDLRENFFNSLLRRPLRQWMEKPEKEYLNLYTNQMESVHQSLFQTWFTFQQIIYETLFTFICLVYIHLKLSLVIFLLISPSLILPRITKRIIQKKTKEQVEAENEMMGSFKDFLRGFETIYNFNIKDRIEKIFSKRAEHVKDKALTLQITIATITRIGSLISHISLLFVIIYSSYLLMNGQISLVHLVAAIELMQRLQTNMNMVSPYMNVFNRVHVPLKNIEDEIKKPREIKKKIGTQVKEISPIHFDHVGFSYDPQKAPVIRDFNGTIKEKGIYLFTGESGSGKSTIMNLLLDYYDLDHGAITLNGVDHEKIDNLFDLITITRQEPRLLNDTVKNNITLYQNYDQEKIQNILKGLGLESFIDDSIYHRNLKHGGINLSGGEAKRINLARSILRPSEILILDEPFANIDKKNIELIADEILSIDDRYIFIVTHHVPEIIKEHCIQTFKFPS
ncbi:MAG: ABC transporter ATP-binding protein, partial [Tissierellia bacterium]|nr:ABC transporter ATP-binding protein [Tissierellia bacterium]